MTLLAAQLPAPPARDPARCHVREIGLGVWRCSVHDYDDPTWQVAHSLGARLPCRIPMDFGFCRELALSPKLDAGTAALLAHDPEVDHVLARNRACPQYLLAELSRGPAPVRVAVALNGSAPAWVLRRLATDEDSTVRSCVALNQQTPLDALQQLAADGDNSVRSDVAVHSTLPRAALEALARDPNEWVRQRVAINPSLPPDLLRQLIGDPEAEGPQPQAG